MNTTHTSIEQYYVKSFLVEHNEFFEHAVVINTQVDLEKYDENSIQTLFIPQLLNSAHDYEAVVKKAFQVLKPGGVMLATLTSIALPINQEGRSWGFTIASAQYIFVKFFKVENIVVKNFGNALAGRLSLTGVSKEDIAAEKLDYADPFFPVVVGVKAVK